MVSDQQKTVPATASQQGLNIVTVLWQTDKVVVNWILKC